MLPEDPLSKHFRLTPVQLRALKKLGLGTVRDLLYHFPARYDQGGGESNITGLVAGESVTIFGTISKLDTRKSCVNVCSVLKKVEMLPCSLCRVINLVRQVADRARKLSTWVKIKVDIKPSTLWIEFCFHDGPFFTKT